MLGVKVVPAGDDHDVTMSTPAEKPLQCAYGCFFFLQLRAFGSACRRELDRRKGLLHSLAYFPCTVRVRERQVPLRPVSRENGFLRFGGKSIRRAREVRGRGHVVGVRAPCVRVGSLTSVRLPSPARTWIHLSPLNLTQPCPHTTRSHPGLVMIPWWSEPGARFSLSVSVSGLHPAPLLLGDTAFS